MQKNGEKMKKLKSIIPGTAVCAVIAAAATLTGGISIGGFSFELIGAPVIAILLGMILTLVFPKLASLTSLSGGIKFTSKKILQWAVVILGFSLNLSTIAQVGAKSLPVIVGTISISLIVAFIMMKIMKVDPKTACLIGVGSSICGGSAIAATAPVIEADDEDVARSISVIFLFNVLAGTAVNDTSSVTAAASTAEGIYGYSGILSAAVTVKLTRTLAIIPITLVLALYRTAKAQKSGGGKSGFSIKKIFPWFILFFVGASLVTTVCGLLPENSVTLFYSSQFVPFAKWLAKFFIAMAMGAIGLNTNIVKLIRNGGKPIILGLCCWVSITAVSLGVQSVTGLFTSNL